MDPAERTRSPHQTTHILCLGDTSREPQLAVVYAVLRGMAEYVAVSLGETYVVAQAGEVYAAASGAAKYVAVPRETA